MSCSNHESLKVEEIVQQEPIAINDSPRINQDSQRINQDSPRINQDLPRVSQDSPRISQDSTKISQDSLLISQPTCPAANWKDLNCTPSRWEGKLPLLDELLMDVLRLQVVEGDVLADLPVKIHADEKTPSPRSNISKKFWRLFTPGSIFKSAVNGGIYLAVLVHDGYNALVTSNGRLPLVEIDTDFSKSSLQGDIQWMMKVSCMWQDAKVLRTEIHSSPEMTGSKLFRSKFLETVINLQTILGVDDIGQLHYRPIVDASTGSVIMVAVRSISDLSLVGTSRHAKSTPLSKLIGFPFAQPKNSEAESIIDMIAFQHSSSLPLSKGLYLGYLKLSSSLVEICIRTHTHQPNVLQNVRVRTNNHVCREEWEWLNSWNNAEAKKSSPTATQLLFHNEIATACDQLFAELKISKAEAENHRFYDLEVIDLGHDVSFIIVVPAIKDVCRGPALTDEHTGTRQLEVPSQLMPIKAFEYLHMRTYFPDLIQRYSQLYCYLDARVDSVLQQCRQACSKNEVSSAKERLQYYSDKQHQLEQVFRSVRWIMDVIGKARDPAVCVGPSVALMYSTLQNLPNTATAVGGAKMKGQRLKRGQSFFKLI